ncbi:Teneurin-3 [Lamellibrachia satsuma]|nr:Teneurin-3 [Lamellibrachia satsuma]
MKVYALNWQLQREPVVLLNTTDSGREVFPVTSNYYKLGEPATYEVPPGGFWRNQFNIVHSQFIKVNVTLPPAIIAVYARRSVPPTHAQYDFYEVLDGKRIISSPRQKRDVLKSAPSGDVQHQTAFKMFMDAGRWYLFFYNDDNKSQTVSFVATEHAFSLSAAFSMSAAFSL